MAMRTVFKVSTHITRVAMVQLSLKLTFAHALVSFADFADLLSSYSHA